MDIYDTQYSGSPEVIKVSSLKLGAVLLASGFGRRFGSNKLLAQVDGVSLIQRTMDAIPSSFFACAVVCSSNKEILELAQRSSYLPLYNKNAEEGISASIRLGLSAMDGMDGVLFTVCDQPALTQHSVCRLIRTFSQSPESICALSWDGVRGNPVIFPVEFFPALRALTGEVGGGAVIKRNLDRLLLVEAASSAELKDVDTKEDLFHFCV